MKVGSAKAETNRERLAPSPPYGLPLSIAARLTMSPPIPITRPLPAMSAMNAQLRGKAVRTGMSIAMAIGAAKATYGAHRKIGDAFGVIVRCLRKSLDKS